jgi:hypothetical protein
MKRFRLLMGGLVILFLAPVALALMFWYMGLACYYRGLSPCLRSLSFDHIYVWFKVNTLVAALTGPFAAIVILVWIFEEINRRPSRFN